MYGLMVKLEVRNIAEMDKQGRGRGLLFCYVVVNPLVSYRGKNLSKHESSKNHETLTKNEAEMGCKEGMH